MTGCLCRDEIFTVIWDISNIIFVEFCKERLRVIRSNPSLPRYWHRLIRVVRLTSSSKLNVKRRLMFLLLTLSTGKCFIGINHCSAGTATLSNISISNLAPGVQRYHTAAATVWSRPPRTPSLPSLPLGDGEIVYLYVRDTARGF